jgi:hypothetical protein
MGDLEMQSISCFRFCTLQNLGFGFWMHEEVIGRVKKGTLPMTLKFGFDVTHVIVVRTSRHLCQVTAAPKVEKNNGVSIVE